MKNEGYFKKHDQLVKHFENCPMVCSIIFQVGIFIETNPVNGSLWNDSAFSPRRGVIPYLSAIPILKHHEDPPYGSLHPDMSSQPGILPSRQLQTSCCFNLPPVSFTLELHPSKIPLFPLLHRPGCRNYELQFLDKIETYTLGHCIHFPY